MSVRAVENKGLTDSIKATVKKHEDNYARPRIPPLLKRGRGNSMKNVSIIPYRKDWSVNYRQV